MRNERYHVDDASLVRQLLVFIDDNPVERNLVQNLRMVAVPELPEDPTGYLSAIEAELYFETVSFSQEDTERSGFYRENAARAAQMATFTDQGEYLIWLNQAAEAGDFDRVNLARMAQPVNKSNQFNLTTIRYSESELIHLAAETGSRVRYYRLMDRFGDNGLISVVVLKKIGQDVLEVDLWVMSCRVLVRTIEVFIFNDMVEVARTLGCNVVLGRYRPSAKNKLVVGLYERLGLTKVSESSEETVWRLALDGDLAARRTYVTAAHVNEGELADA
jgi:FkbH-like protein